MLLTLLGCLLALNATHRQSPDDGWWPDGRPCLNDVSVKGCRRSGVAVRTLSSVVVCVRCRSCEPCGGWPTASERKQAGLRAGWRALRRWRAFRRLVLTIQRFSRVKKKLELIAKKPIHGHKAMSIGSVFERRISYHRTGTCDRTLCHVHGSGQANRPTGSTSILWAYSL